MATVARQRLPECDGFRVESPSGLFGWVEETWLAPSGEPTALAVRMLDGRRGLLVLEDVETVLPESEIVIAAPAGRLLELDVPRVEPSSAEAGPERLSASWGTTGELLEPPPPPGLLRRASLSLRPWRLAPPPRPEAERPLWQLVGLLYTVIALVVALLIGASFLVAQLVTGSAY
jgi:hypothetical protein